MIVLDNSYSMDYRGTDGKSSFEQRQSGRSGSLDHVLEGRAMRSR